MKKFLFLLTAIFMVASLNAAPVDQATAFQKAKSYLANELYAGKVMAPAALNPVLLRAEIGDAKLGQPVFYIFNTSTTYLVVAGDDRAEEILMIGDRPLKDINNLAPGLQDILNQYKQEIMFLQEHPGLRVDKRITTQNTMIRATYGPLLTAMWDQSDPYWNQCKFTYNNRSYQCLTGCPATSASMVMYFWKHPTAQVAAIPSYTAELDLSYYNVINNYTYPALSATTFDWANMKDSYTSYTTAQGNAVATLMRYVGQAEHMMYGTESAGGSGIYTTDTQNIVDMFVLFGYDQSTCRVVSKSSYSAANWATLIQNEMAAGRPIVFTAVDNSAGGHAFNVDGYNSSTDKYHCNFGWSGDGNNWYSMNAFSYGGYTFNQGQQAVIGIQPPGGSSTAPQLTVDPTSLSFTGCTVGQTYTKTFTVNAANLTDNVTISSNNSSFTVSPSTLTKAQAQAGATITVTFAPTTSGSKNATITIASTGATSKTVSVTGNATAPAATLTVNPTSLSFAGCSVGQTYTQTFTVTGANLTNNVTLTSSNGRFTVSPSTLTAAQAMAGATITVTYSPTAAGTQTGTITVACSGATSKTVSVSGTATSTPTIVVDPTSLSLSTEVGTPVTKTFTVTASNLSAGVKLALSGSNFAIDKTNIVKSAFNNGAAVTVTVTYSPTTAGNHTGTITLTSTGASDVTVQLNGTATAPPAALTVDPASLSFTDCTVGQTYTKTFTVTGTNLTGNVTLTSSNGRFTVSPSTLTAAQAQAGATVTVTYSPNAAGTQNGTITVASAGATSKTVSVTGAAVSAPTITVNPSSVSLNTEVGTQVSQTINLQGINLTAGVNIAVNGEGFSVDKTNITRTAATQGATFTVFYNPTAAGNHTGTVTLTSTGAATVTIPLNGTATEPVRLITATPSTLNFVALVGEVKTNTFVVTGTNLTGPLTLAVNNNAYSVSPTTITAAEAAAGKTVTVTYAPTAFGVTSATVTITGGGAPAATVTLNGQADLVKYAPVMLPANETYINLTKFRADWTDETPGDNVASYTLEVSAKAVEPEPEPELIASLSGTQYNGNGYYNVSLTAPWGGTNTKGHNNEIIYFRNNYNNDGSYGNITYTVPAGYENAVFTMKITSGTSTDEAVGNLTVATPQTAGTTHYFNPQETYAWVVVASSGDKITITTPDAQYSPDIALIEVWSGDASGAKLMANESGDATYRLITGITSKFYTVENLTAEGTFLYKVKAIYQDGTESEWSNIEEVTLFQNEFGHTLGDVNHDGTVSVIDVTTLIDALLDDPSGLCQTCADVNQDGTISVVDVTTLIDMLLGGGASTLNVAMPINRVFNLER